MSTSNSVLVDLLIRSQCRHGAARNNCQICSRLVCDRHDELAGDLCAGRVAGAQFMSDCVQFTSVASLEQISDCSIRPVLILRPQSQPGKQERRLAKKLLAGLGLSEDRRVGLDLSCRPGEQLIQAVHLPSIPEGWPLTKARMSSLSALAHLMSDAGPEYDRSAAACEQFCGWRWHEA